MQEDVGPPSISCGPEDDPPFFSLGNFLLSRSSFLPPLHESAYAWEIIKVFLNSFDAGFLWLLSG